LAHSFEVEQLDIPELLLITPRVYEDDRGAFTEVFKLQDYEEVGIAETFVQSNVSHSKSGVLRGMHYQLKHPQAKLFTVISGEVLDVAIDIRVGSPTFGKSDGRVLKGESKSQLFIPTGFAHGFCVISEEATIHYMCSDYYAPDDERGIRWDDPAVNIEWPVDNPSLSPKDAVLPNLTEVDDVQLPRF
jgi:dTDP-4-dehydrorhamnose 3,5-epimerase